MQRFEKRFETWTEFLDYCANAPSEMQKQDRVSRSNPNYPSFASADSWEDVLALAQEGWPEGLKASKDISSKMFNHISQMIEKLTVSHDIEGHAIDVARFVDGEPEAWLKFEDVLQEAEGGHKLIRISFNCTVSAGVSKETIVRKGATIAALIELLEYAGHRVELTLYEAVSPRGFFPGDSDVLGILAAVKLKTFDQNLDLGRISYALAHPSVSRALMFSVAETAPEDVRRACNICLYGSYGSPGVIPKEDQGDIYISSSRYGDRQWSSPEAAEDWIIQELEKQGIHLKKEVHDNELPTRSEL